MKTYLTCIPTFKVKDNVTVCILRCRLNLDKILGNDIIFRDIINHNMITEFTVIGRAKCSKDDVFNKQFGERLAQSRAKAKAFSKAHKRIGKFGLRLANLTDRFYSAFDGNYKAAKIETERVKEMSNGN